MKKGEKEKHPIELKKRGEDRRRKERREGKKREERKKKAQLDVITAQPARKEERRKKGGGAIGCQSYTSNLPLTHPLGTLPSPRQTNDTMEDHHWRPKASRHAA